MKKCFYLLLLLIPFIMPKNVSAKILYEEAVPDRAAVIREDGTTSAQTITAFNSSVIRYYGFYQTTSASRPQIYYHFNEHSSINDKFIESIHFNFYGANWSTYYVPYTFTLVDSYNNILTCESDSTGGWQNDIINGQYSGINTLGSRNVTGVSCYGGHLSGEFYLNVGGDYVNKIGWYAVSELSIHYNDGTDNNSSVLNDIKDNTTATKNNSNDIKNNTKETNDLIKNTDTSDSQNSASAFFSDFSRNSHGLTGIVTAPLRLIESFTTASCSPITFQLPFVNNWVTLPCMKSIYENHFGVFFTLYQLITTGVICYGVCINLYSKLRQLENPNNDRIEVLQL